MNYSTILKPQISNVVQSSSINIVNQSYEENSNHIFDWVTVSGSVKIGSVFCHQSGSWALASIDSDADAEAVGIVENVVTTVSGSLVKLIFKGIINFSHDNSISLFEGQPYFLSTTNNLNSNVGPTSVRNTTIQEPSISKPIFIAQSSTTALVVNMRGLASNSNAIIPPSNIPFTPDISCPTPPPPLPPRKLFLYVSFGPCPPDNLNCDKVGNTYQVATCPDGVTTSSVAPNTFYDYLQADANEEALAYAESQLVCVPHTYNSTVNVGQGLSFSYQITGSNNPTIYSASYIPAGLSLNTSTGLLTGTITDSSLTVYSSSIFSINSYGTGSGILTINVVADPIAFYVQQYQSAGSSWTGALYGYVSVDGSPYSLVTFATASGGALQSSTYHATNQLKMKLSVWSQSYWDDISIGTSELGLTVTSNASSLKLNTSSSYNNFHAIVPQVSIDGELVSSGWNSYPDSELLITSSGTFDLTSPSAYSASSELVGGTLGISGGAPGVGYMRLSSGSYIETIINLTQ